MFARTLNVLVNGVAFATAAVISVGYPTIVHAQLRVEIAAALGAYVPGLGLPYPRIATCFLKSGGPDWRCGPLPSYTQTRAPAVGGRITASPWNRGASAGPVAFEGSFWYVPSRVIEQSPYPDIPGLNQAGKMVAASLRLVLRFAPRAQVSGLLMGGPALIHRSGQFYSGLKGTTSAGGSLGVGVDVRRFGLRAEIATYFYNLHFGDSLTPDQQIAQQQGYLYAPSAMQSDFVFSLSINPFGPFGQHGERQR
jgi:hypothetical protein